MLKTVTRPDRKKVHFTYDALGRRLTKTYEGQTTHFVWDGNVPLHEWTTASDESVFGVSEPSSGVGMKGKLEFSIPDNLTTWVFEDGTFIPMAKLENGKSFSIVTDHLGTPIEAYDEEGEKVWSRELNIYGVIRKETGEKNFIPYFYQGQYFDSETTLAYNRFRYYNPESGTYISQDPIGLISQELNYYAYVEDVNSWVDVFGLKKKSSHRKPKHTRTKSTGRTRAKNKNELFAMSHVQKHPENGSVIVKDSKINDPAYKGKGYNKMSQKVNGVDVHYMAKFDKQGKMTEVTDFKFKDNKVKPKGCK